MRRRLRWTLLLAGKDWRLFFADRRAALLCFAVPILLASAFGTVFRGPAGDPSQLRLPLLVVDQDGGGLSRAVTADLLNHPRFDARTADLAEAERLTRSDKGVVAVVLPAGFGDAVGDLAGDAPTVTLIRHPMSRLEGQVVEGLLTEAVMRRLAKKYAKFLPGGLRRPFAAEHRAAGLAGGAFNSYSHSFSGMTLQYLLFWGMESGLLLLRERRAGVWKRLRTGPVPLGVILAGRALSTAAVAALIIAATFGFGRLAFGVTVEGNWLGFALLAGAVSLLASCTGLLVATLSGTEARARNLSILVILGVSMLGGLWLPTFLLPEWMRSLSGWLPTTWAMRAFDRVTWQASPLAEVLPGVAAVAAFAACGLVLAAWRVRRLERLAQAGGDDGPTGDAAGDSLADGRGGGEAAGGADRPAGPVRQDAGHGRVPRRRGRLGLWRPVGQRDESGGR